jgi:hypothetical protein
VSVSGRPSAAELLADRLALALVECGPLPCERLARIVERRTADVRRELLRDERFERVGKGHGSRWELRLSPLARPWDGLGRRVPAGSRSDDVRALTDRVEAIARLVGELDRRLAALEVSMP